MTASPVSAELEYRVTLSRCHILHTNAVYEHNMNMHSLIDEVLAGTGATRVYLACVSSLDPYETTPWNVTLH